MHPCPPVRRSFSDERGPGAFLSLGALPKRKPDVSSRKSPVFHIAQDDDDEHLSSLDEQSPPPVTPPAAVPFPRSTSPPSPTSPPSSSTSGSSSPRPQLSRGSSTPIFLSNGKPLKSSLKSASSSPSILTDPYAQHMHLRARSEPPCFAAQHKNVHFPDKDYGLATVRIFSRSARPASLSNPSNGDETETEGEDNQPTRFPFPRTSPAFHYELDPSKSSLVPSPRVARQTNLLLESVNLSLSSCSPSLAGTKPGLTGFILVRNVAFEKHVAVRFTLDDWQTVSEVSAHYVDSLPALPSHITCHSSDIGDSPHPLEESGWDRFTFTIRLEDYSHSLSTRTLWLAARYRVNCTYPTSGSCQYGPGGEWWDNNDGGNYRISFRPALPAAALLSSRPRRETTPAPITAPQTRLQPPLTCKDHALGLMVPSEPSHKGSSSISSLGETHKVPPRAGKLSLLNYAPPIARATSSITSSSASTPRRSSPPPRLPGLKSPATVRMHSDEDTSSPASSTLSTPSVSPTMVPRVIIGGQPATSSHLYGSCEKDEESPITRHPGHIQDWDWSALGKQSVDGLPRRASDPVSIPEGPARWQGISRSPNTGQSAAQGRPGGNDSNSLYNAFVTQWCFAQGPSPNHSYVDGGILA